MFWVLRLSPWEVRQIKKHLLDALSGRSIAKVVSVFLYYALLFFSYVSYPVKRCYFVIKRFVFNKSKKLYKLSVVAIAKNEGDYIREWVDYHKAIGVSHIFLFDNDSTDNVTDLIKQDINSGYVDIIPFSGAGVQLKAYAFALKKWGRYCEYMAFIDCDEFFVTTGSRDFIDIIDDLFARKCVAAIAINWQVYGSSGHVYKPMGGGA